MGEIIRFRILCVLSKTFKIICKLLYLNKEYGTHVYLINLYLKYNITHLIEY